MNYYKWNNLIGDSLFNKQKDEIVFLYITKEQLINRYKETNFSDDRDEQSIWRDFVDAVNNLSKDSDSYPHITFPTTNNSFGDRIRRLRDFTRRQDYPYKYPAYLAHLVLLVMGKAGSKGNSDAEVKSVIKDFFTQEGICCGENEFNAGEQYVIKNICCSNPLGQNSKYDGGIWKEFNFWSIKNAKGTTYFNFVNERYVGMIIDQCLISANVRENIRELYSKAGLRKDGKYTLEDFRLHLLSQSKLAAYFNNEKAKTLIKTDINLVKVLYHDFEQWDGTYETESDGIKKLTKTYNLQICCLVNPSEKTFHIEYRIKDSLPEDGIHAKYEDGTTIDIVEEVAGWSTPVSSSKIREIGEKYHRTSIVFKEEANDIYFMTRKKEFGNKTVFVSADAVLENGFKVFFISRKDFGECEKYFTKLELTNSEGYKLYTYIVNEDDSLFTEDGLFYRYLNKESVETKKTICIEGGLKIGNNKYLPGLLPSLVDYSFRENLILCDVNSNREYLLNYSDTDTLYDYKYWTIPEDILPGTYNLNDTKTSLTILNPKDLLPGKVNHLCFGKDWKTRDISYFEENELPCFQDNHFHSWRINYLNRDRSLIENQYPEEYMCHVNHATLSKTTTELKFNFGDILIDWLYYRGECSKDEFVEAYKFIQSQYKINNPNQKVFYTTSAYSALKWLQKAGFVDYYDTKIYPCSPRLVALPVERDRCNKFHLVGCRSLRLLSSVTKECVKKNETFRFLAYQTTSDYLMSRLTPSSIFIECAGISTDNFGFDKIVRYFCNESLKVLPPKPSYLTSISDFSTGIDDLISGWENINTLNFSSRDKFYIFEIDSLEVNKNQKYNIYELLEVLQGVSLVQLFYNDYRYDNIIIDKVNNRLFRVPNENESLGKLYVIKQNDKEAFTKKCVRWCENSKTGEVGLAVSKRIGLPRNLSLLMNYVSLFPPEVVPFPQIESQHRFYYYIIKKGIWKEKIRAIIGDKLKMDLKQNTLKL